MHKSTQGFEKIDQSLFFKGGAMGAIINNYPWKDHPLGLPDSWKQELITTINLLLHARFPMFLFWGEESFCFYNDAYLPSLGKEGEGKHPCIGKKAKEVWPESWDIIGPQIEEVMKTGEASWNENRPSILYRNNRMENVYWTYSYSPVYTKEGVIEGALVTCIETTEEVLSKRALVETEQTLELALDASNIGIWEWNVQTGKIRWDKQMFGLYGMLPSEDSFLDYTVWRSAVHPEDVSEQESILNGTIQAKQGSKRKFRIFKHDSKELRYFESVDAVRLNGKGETEIIVGTNVDITEQVLLEQQIKNQIEELENLYRTTPIGLGILDKEFKFVRINERLAEINGMSIEEHTGKTIYEIVPDIADQAAMVLRQIFNTGIPILDTEIKGETKAQPGVERIWSENFYPIKNHKNEIIAISIVAEEITEKKKTEDALKESEKRFRSIADDAPAFIFMGNSNAQIEYINTTWKQFAGLDEHYSLGEGWIQVTHPDDIERSYEIYNNAFNSRSSYQYEMRQKGVDGHYHWILWKGIPRFLPSGEFLGILGFGFDISERKIAEQTVLENEAHFRSLAESLPYMIWTMDANGNLTYASKQWKEYSGIDDPVKAFEYMLHPDEDLVITSWIEHFQSKQPYVKEIKLLNKNGEYRWHHLIAEPIKGEDGKVVKWVGAMTDVHIQKTFVEQLENLVEERTVELKRSNEDLQQFAHVISHDLKEPIRKILIFLDKLKQESAEGISEKSIHYFDRLKTSGVRIYDMINSMLDYSQIEAQNVKSEPINTHLLVDDVIIELELLIEEKRAQIIVESLPVISGYRMLIHQLFYNLIYNALKFSKPDVRPVITIKGESKPNENCIIVTDNGIGFSPDKASKIFDIYVQLNSKEQFGGTGMGLAFCKKIVERHGGKIKAFGRENEGAEFVITFPIRN